MNMEINQHVHFIGIGGYGMSAIARVLLDLGCHVSGSDVSRNKLVESLMERGAQVMIGHDAKHVQGADVVVYSTSIAPDNIERVTAQQLGIETIHRSQMLARLFNDKKGIAVAGAHGKTTTSSMIAQTMEICHLDPTYVIGGEVVGLKSNAKAGKSEFVVAEADESDGTFLNYYPYLAVVTNIEADHLENYDGNFQNLLQAYASFVRQIHPQGLAVLCWDDPYVRQLAEHVKGNYTTYGIHNAQADVRAVRIQERERTISFTVVEGGEELGEITLSIPGLHNVTNALAVVVACRQLGLPFAEIAQALAQFSGAKRRFQVIGEINHILVVDDYAHHPTEIQATLKAAKALKRKLYVVFQPQRYSRTHLLMKEFSQSFAEADEVIINTIYAPPGEQPIEGVTAENLTALIKENSNPNTRFIDSQEEIVQTLLQEVQPHDLVITMGAGDIWHVSHQLVAALQESSSQLNQV